MISTRKACRSLASAGWIVLMASTGGRIDPYPKTTVPLKLKEIFHSLGIKADEKERVPWNIVPYILYDKGFYLAGLPTSIFYGTDKPSDEQRRQRLETYLQWPPPGPNPLVLLKQACSTDGLVRLVPRPDGSDIVFQTISEDGTTLDIPRWRAPRPARKTIAKHTQPSGPSLPFASSPHPPEVLNRKFTSAPGNATVQQPSAPESLNTSAHVTQPTLNEPGPPDPRQISTLTPLPSLGNPFPGSAVVAPLAFRQLLKSLGLQETKQGFIPWRALPDQLWTKGLYITGIPASVFLGSIDPAIDVIENALKGNLTPRWNPSTQSALLKASEKGDIKVLPRPKDRDVILEVITKHGPVDLVKWRAQPQVARAQRIRPPPVVMSPSVSPSDEGGDTRSITPTTPITPHRSQSASLRKALIEGGNKRQPKSTLRSRKKETKEEEVDLFRYAKEVPLKLRKLLLQAGIEEDPEERGYIPWETIPHQLWNKGVYISGFPANFVLGKKSLEQIRKFPWKPQRFFLQNAEATHGLQKVLNQGLVQVQKRPLDRDVVFEIIDEKGTHIDIGKWEEIDAESESDGHMDEVMPQKPTTSGQSWHAQVTALMDQLAEMLVEAGVQLAPHETRQGKYKIVWHTLPKLLHQAKVCLVGFPLELLPYFKLHKQLLGRWAIRWNGETLDKVVNLLDYEGIAVEKWDETTQTIVQAFNEQNERFEFTWDDFINAEKDDPDMRARNGVIMALVDGSSIGRRRRRADTSEDEDSAMQYDSPDTLSGQTKRKGSFVFDHRIVKRPRVAASDDEMMKIEVGTSADVDLRPSQDETQSEVETLLGGMSLEGEPITGPMHQSVETFRSMNRKLRRRKESIKSLIAILLYHQIPCIYDNGREVSYFLPWTQLPRHLAARRYYLAGFPDVCAPVVDNDLVLIQSGPRYWDDAQWEALEKALKEDKIDAFPSPRKAMFELVEKDGKLTMSNLGYSKSWLQSHFGTEAGSSASIYAWDPDVMDPIVMETELEWGPEDLP